MRLRRTAGRMTTLTGKHEGELVKSKGIQFRLARPPKRSHTTPPSHLVSLQPQHLFRRRKQSWNFASPLYKSMFKCLDFFPNPIRVFALHIM